MSTGYLAIAYDRPMRLTCDSADLAAALAVVMRAAAARTSLPVLGMVLLETADDGLRLTATNLEMAIRRTLPAAVAEEGAVAVPGRLLADFTGALPREELRLALEEPGSRLVLRSDSFSTEINGVPGDEFPPVTSAGDGDRLTLPAPLLVGAVTDTLVAASTDEARPVLTGVRLETASGRLTLLASDGHRLAVRGVDIHASLAAGGITVPARALAEAVRLFRAVDGDIEVVVSATGNQVVLRAPGVELASRVIDGTYPNLMRLVPDASGTRVVVQAAELGARLRALTPFAETSANVVRLDVAPGSITLSAATVDVGSARTELPAQVDGPETSVAFNARYLLDCPALATDERIEVHLQGPLGAFTVRRVGRDDYVYLFMPIRYPLRTEHRAASLT
jgi:DNA polymerase-3 subunit beta